MLNNSMFTWKFDILKMEEGEKKYFIYELAKEVTFLEKNFD